MSHTEPPRKSVRDPLGPLEQAAAAEEILSPLRHDLRNRFATVRNAIYYIRRRLAGSELCSMDPRIAQFLDTIDAEMVASNAMLSEGSVSAHIKVEPARRASVPDCVERAASLWRDSGGSIRIDTALAPGHVDIDPGELAMVVRILIENAAEAMPSGGVVRIRAAPEGSMFLIEVADEGTGLPETAGHALFQAFFTTKPGHTGLGLSIASRVARRAGGQLSLRQQPKGVVAALSLPLSTRER